MQGMTLWGISCTTSTAASESTFQGICLSAWTMKPRSSKRPLKRLFLQVILLCNALAFYNSLTFFAVRVTVVTCCTITDVWCITRSAILTIRVTRCYQQKNKENYIKKTTMRGEVQKPVEFISHRGQLLIWNTRGRLSFELTCVSSTKSYLLCIFVPVIRFGS